MALSLPNEAALAGSGFQSWMPHHQGHRHTPSNLQVCGTHILALILMLDQKTHTEARCDTGVSKTIGFGTPKSNGLSSWFLLNLWFGGTVYFISGLTQTNIYLYDSIRYYFQLPCKDCGPWGPSFQTQVIETSKHMDHLGCIYCKQEKGCP